MKVFYSRMAAMCLLLMLATVGRAGTFKDFAVIVNNQEGTLLTSDEQVQGTDINFGVAVADNGTVSRVAADDASSVATVSGKYHSDHGCTGLKVVAPVEGSVKILVGQCTYSGKTIYVTNSDGATVASKTPAQACWKNDRSNVTELIYSGPATTLTITGMDYCPYVAVKTYVEPAPYKDFAVIVNNQTGTLLTEAEMATQYTPFIFGVAVAEDGTVSRVAEGDANSVATVSGKFHSDHGSTNLKVVVPVPGAVKILVGQCTYSSSDIVVTNSDGETVATTTPATACWKNDRSNVTELTYSGPATTLTITGMSYCPYVALVKIADPIPDITATWDYGNTSVMNETMALSGKTEAGTVKSVESEDIVMTVEANGASFRNNGNNIQVGKGASFKIPVKNAGDLITIKGYPGYSKYTIGTSNEIMTDENTYKAKISDAEAGYVAVTSADNNNYYLSLSVVLYAPKEKITLDNEAVAINYPFGEGTEGQKATFSNDDYFMNSSVSHGSNWSIQDSQTYADTKETRLAPVDQHNDNLTDDDAVRFLFTPKPGFSFTPTKVSFKANRFGTDNGLIDAYWQNPDGTLVELETGIKPERNNSGVNTVKSYDIEGATPGEGACGLKLFLYHLQAGKQIGLADIVIEGTLNGTEKDVPVLASFKVNGKEYTVEDVFGESYEATFELPKAEAMVGTANPLAEVTPSSGDLGQITYDGNETACTVTIPMSAGATVMNYVLNVVYKPDFTLEYIGVDGSVIATQTVEKDAAIGQFAADIAAVPATKEGYKARGWFKQGVLGAKFTTADVITANTKLYAIQTEIEEPSTHKKYIFDLADKFFFAEDHEAFNPSGDGFYWHDAQHGWAFKNGNKVDLLVGPKATITVTLCQYGSGTGIVVTKDGETLGTLDGIAEGDGGTTVFNYEGTPGTLTLEMQCGGEMYIHGMKIVNTSEVNFDSEGNWYFVKAGDASSLIDVIEVVNGMNASKDAQRSFIFLPDGTYDLDATVKTAISGHNISLIGQSMDKTIIVTTPDKSVEGLGKADLLDVSGTNLYMQDLTLKNALDYYNAGSAGRAAALQDAGTRTIAKNVRLLSYQDTYYSSNSSQQAYWETCDIHGTVDFICGGGDIRFQNTTLSLEPRALNGSGSRTIVAPTTNTKFGYVFDGCTVVDLANGKGTWNFGRTWQNNPISVYLNTTLDANAAATIISTRWIEKGMNNKDPKLFGEYGTVDAAGNDITPATNTINSFGGAFQTILSADEASAFDYDKMFTDWNPAALAKQAAAPANVKLEGNQLTWDAAADAQCWAVIKDGVVVAITTTPAYTVDNTEAEYCVRAANAMGGFGEAGYVPTYTTVNVASVGYATFFDSQTSYLVPEGMEAYVVTSATEDALEYSQLEGIIPAATAVMLKTNDGQGGEYTLTSTRAAAVYGGANLLNGSDEATLTFGDNCLFYKLTFGHSGSDMANKFGWYWGAADGAAFQIEGHRAWLCVPTAVATTRGYSLTGSDATSIDNVQRSTLDGPTYNMQGQRVASPRKGLYIRDNKKVLVK